MLGVTNFVLEELKKYRAKATFFCIGENVKKHQNIYLKIQEERHSVGNHTFNHLNGLLTKNNRYIENIQQASAYIVSKLFRGTAEPNQLKYWHLALRFVSISFHHLYRS